MSKSTLVVSMYEERIFWERTFQRYQLCPVFSYVINNDIPTWNIARDCIYDYAMYFNKKRLIGYLEIADSDYYSEAQKFQIMYTNPTDFYQIINEGLRKCENNVIFTTKIIPFIVGLQKHCTEEYNNYTLYRGLNSQDLEYWQNVVSTQQIIEEKGFMSTTTDHDIAYEFACKRGKKPNGVVLTLTGICYGCKPEGMVEDEEEILLSPNQWIKCFSMELFENSYRPPEPYAEIQCVFVPDYLQFN